MQTPLSFYIKSKVDNLCPPYLLYYTCKLLFNRQNIPHDHVDTLDAFEWEVADLVAHLCDDGIFCIIYWLRIGKQLRQ